MKPELKIKHVCLFKLNSACNFDCRYCFGHSQRDNPDVGKFTPQEIARSFDNTGFTWWIGLSGGEPFLYPKFEKLVKELTRKHFVHIDTNLSCDMNKFMDIAIDPSRVIYIHCAFHIEVLEARRQIDLFLRNVLALRKRGFSLVLSSVAYPPVLNRMEKYISLFKSLGLTLQPKIFLSGDINNCFSKINCYPEAYSDKQRFQIKKYLNDKVSAKLLNGLFSYKGKRCSAGKYFIRVHENGETDRCITENTPMGNLFKGRLKLFSKSLPCKFGYCTCPFITNLNIVEGARNYRKEFSKAIHLNDMKL